MFLTERQGGSDVGANTTRAMQDGDEWRALRGEALLLQRRRRHLHRARPTRRARPRARRGLATFIVPSRLPDGSPNGFIVKRLKPKLGTVGVPTGEVTLDGARCWLAGSSGVGGPATRPVTAAASTA